MKSKTTSKSDQIRARIAKADRLQSTITWAKTFDGNINRKDLVMLNYIEGFFLKPGGGEPLVGDQKASLLSVIVEHGPNIQEVPSADLYNVLVGGWLPKAERRLAKMRATVEW